MTKPPGVIHLADAMALLADRQPHRLRLWKLSTGDILTYPHAVAIGSWTRAGLHRVRLEPSGEVRAFRDISLFEIDDMTVYI